MSTNAPPPQESNVPRIEDKVRKPLGVLPRNAQAWVLIGVAALMIAVLALSGRRPERAAEEIDSRRSSAVDPSEARIEEYRNRIEEHARKLRAEQERLRETRQAMSTGEPRVGGALIEASDPSPPPGAYAYPPTPERDEKSAVERDRGRRAYESLFASNVALSYRRPDRESSVEAPSLAELTTYRRLYGVVPATTEGGEALQAPRGRTQRREPQSGEQKRSGPDPVGESDAHELLLDPELTQAEGKKHRLFEGQWIETVLTNRLNASFAGPVNCMVTTSVYSRDRQKLLIPQGSRILGEVRRVDHFGQQRVAVFFHRIIMPDGYSVSLDRFQGLNQIGETGLKDKVNHHYFRIFGGSIALGALAGFSLQNTNLGFAQSGTDAYRAGVAQSLSQSSQRILDRFLNILPTITIREGHRVKAYLTADLLLPAYAQHQMPSDL